MNDARDQINLAAWIERRMDAIGPYGPHILDGVRRYETRIAHHDDVVRELMAALETAATTLDAWADGYPCETLDVVRAALAKIAQEG